MGNSNLFILAIIIMVVLAIGGGITGYALHYFKSRLDALEDDRRKRRGNREVNDMAEDATAILLRLIRDVEDFMKYQRDVERWGGVLRNELERALDQVHGIRGNGQHKMKGNGK